MDNPDTNEQIESIQNMIKKERKNVEKQTRKKRSPKPKKSPKIKIPKVLKEKIPKEPKVLKEKKFTLKIKNIEPKSILFKENTPQERITYEITEKPIQNREPEKSSPKAPLFQPPYNKIFIEVLERLVKLMRKNREPFREKAYKNALDTIRSMTEDINDLKQLEGKKTIGSTILSKFKKYLVNGTLNIFEREKEKPGYELNEVYEQLSNIYGVGPKKAQDLIDKGIKSMDELRERQDELLNDNQKAGLKYYEDIMKRIPRKEIDDYNEIFRRVFDKVSRTNQITDAKYEIVGSYRRGLQESGDIDVIITSKDKTLFKKFTDALLEENIILVTLSCGPSKCLVITRLTPNRVARRVDFLYSPPEEFPFAILYFTGSKEFNTVMRGHALKMGVSLNEHGLSKKEPGKKKEEMISHRFNSENDIFEFLNLEYKEPTERINGLSVILKDMKSMEGFDKDIWKLGSYEESCDEVCNKIKMKCNVDEIKTLDSASKISMVANNNGTECLKHYTTESMPFLEDNGGNGCWYVKPTDKNITRKWCKQKSEKWNNRLCPCTKKNKKIKESKEKSVKPESVKRLQEKKPRKTYKKREPKEPKTEELQKPKESPKIKIDEEIPLVPIITNELQEKKPRKTYKKREPNQLPKQPKTKTIKKIEKNIETNILIEDIGPLNTMSTKQLIEDFKTHGITVLENLKENQLVDMIKDSSHAYYNTNHPFMTDNEYDIVKEYMERKYPKNEIIEQVGAPVIKNKVKLPFNMPSMDKIKPDSGALANWTKKYTGPYVLSCKLDGVSGMYIYDANDAKLYTRGDGYVGQDISYLLKKMNLPNVPNLVVRGEFIIPKKVFDEKYKSSFANPRNLVSGIINSKTVDEKIKDLHFVAYEIIEPLMKPSEQMAKLTEAGFEVVQNKLEQSISNESLSEVLKDWRTTYLYEIDGVIVTDDHMHTRIDGNPDYAFAFKMVMSDQMAEAKVVDVLWEASKSGYLKPRVRIEPIRLGGVTIEYATGFNGKFIEENKIGIGAVIQIIRSGDVIPHIKSITTPAERAKMPTVAYHWTDTHVDIILDNVSEDITVREKNITAFFTTLQVDGLSSGNVKRIMKAGFDTVPKILKMKKGDYAVIPGFKDKMIDKIADGIETKVKSATLLDIMVASNLLGRGLGERKIRPILEAQSQILLSTDSNEEKIKKLKAIPGIGPENANSFVANIPVFLGFLKECDLEYKLETPIQEPKQENTMTEVDTSNPLYGKHIVMTKTRDAAVIEKIKKSGAVLDDNIGKNTNILIVKSKDDVSNKTKYATDNNIPIMTPEEFLEKYK
jgi:NAD-dependent DNA ligase/DNA polymerase/3'-5' exonuclease PolX